MKKIKLTQNKYALVDNEDYLWLNKRKWHASKVNDRNNFYAISAPLKCEKRKKSFRMHVEIMNPPLEMEIDHIDGNGLNNQRKNLRICTRQQNKCNTGKRINNKSGYKGVSWYKNLKKWRVKIQVKKKNIHLGYFTSKTEAYETYCKACIKYHGNFANLK